MKTIKLYGHLGKQFGKIHKYHIETPYEAVQLLIANYKGFEQALLNFTGEGYRVILGKEDARLEDLHSSTGSDTIKIVPVISGQGGGLGTILLGAALIIAAPYAASAILSMGAGAVAGTGMAMSSGYVMAAGAVLSVGSKIGMALVLGGISQMLFTPPKAPTPAKTSTSGYFDGAVNTTRQGMPIPVGYGTLVVGSAVISAGLSTVQVPV